jgi:hypothetical protein
MPRSPSADAGDTAIPSAVDQREQDRGQLSPVSRSRECVGGAEGSYKARSGLQFDKPTCRLDLKGLVGLHPALFRPRAQPAELGQVVLIVDIWELIII